MAVQLEWLFLSTQWLSKLSLKYVPVPQETGINLNQLMFTENLSCLETLLGDGE